MHRDSPDVMHYTSDSGSVPAHYTSTTPVAMTYSSDSESSTSDDSYDDYDDAFKGWSKSGADPLTSAGSLAAHGMIGVRGALAAAETSALRAFVDGHLLRRKKEATAADGAPNEPAAIAAFARWFGSVRQLYQRYDLKLDATEPVVRDALRALCTSIGPILEQSLTSEACVVELSSLISDPGATCQQWHPDSLLPSLVGAPLITCFVALQDIAPDMGPTELLPHTHDVESHQRDVGHAHLAQLEDRAELREALR